MINNSVTSLNNIGLSPYLTGLWFVPGRRYYAVGAGIHQKHLLDDSLWRVYPPGVVTSFTSGGVSGSNVNDVFVVGSFGEVVHFNGYSWRRYYPDVSLPQGAFGNVAIRDNSVMAVGDNGPQGILLRGRRPTTK